MKIKFLASFAALAYVGALVFAAFPVASFAAAPTAAVTGATFASDYTRASPAGTVGATVGDLGITSTGTSVTVAKITNGGGNGVCEGFTTLAAQLQRASVDPNGPNSANVVWSSSGSALAANGSTSITEAGIGWYRWNITTATGTGNCVITWANK